MVKTTRKPFNFEENLKAFKLPGEPEDPKNEFNDRSDAMSMRSTKTNKISNAAKKLSNAIKATGAQLMPLAKASAKT